ncbi:MAG: hypothetical protein AAFQ14_09575 [Cyanobacteria bacterium J06621_12]
MIAFFRPKALFAGTTTFKETTNRNFLSVKHCVSCNYTYAVVVFSHHRDVKVAVDELNCAGFSNDCLTLVARHAQKRLGDLELASNSYFDAQKFNFNQIAQEFFSRLFKKGKYLVLIKGSNKDVRIASKIISRRRDHAEAWLFEE